VRIGVFRVLEQDFIHVSAGVLEELVRAEKGVERNLGGIFYLLKIMRAISQSQSTESSYAFFIRPNFRFVKVT